MELDRGPSGNASRQDQTISQPFEFITFNGIRPEDKTRIGGKAFVLGQLTRAGFPVPRGAVLLSAPTTAQDFDRIFTWWEALGFPALAVRSSAMGEDSSEFSYAGQQITELNVKDAVTLKAAIQRCFESVHRETSRAYRKYFKQDDYVFQMHVVLQEMVNPLFSGVFFSMDPRTHTQGWVLETISGLGEDLVSGRKTPLRLMETQDQESTLEGWKKDFQDDVVKWGKKACETLKYEVDMEWAINQAGVFQVLQARPITALHSRANREKEIEKELNRLKEKSNDNVIWDGQTFSEWTGMPSYLTFSIWKKAFSPSGAFGSALSQLGYVGSETRELHSNETLLERVFGRAYVNLSQLEVLFFGKIPYEIMALPRPHMKFRWSRLNLKMILKAPRVWMRMAHVAWKLHSERGKLLSDCRQALVQFKNEMTRPLDPSMYKSWSTADIQSHFAKECELFSTTYLHWSFILIIMAESTLQSLLKILQRAKGKDLGDQLIRRWMGEGLMTVTTAMNKDYQQACQDPTQRPFFLSRYGHRGPGELDLSHPRWVELGDEAFIRPGREFKQAFVQSVEDEIRRDFSRYKAPIILQEWKFLKKMLELREVWKMELLKVYAHMRWMALELGARTELHDDIFWLRLSETLGQRSVENSVAINDRKQRFNIFRSLSFPVVVSLEDIKKTLSGESISKKEKVMEGESLSPGIAFGQVRVVHHPHEVNVDSWPEDVILVAEATDPGWTPLFQRVKGVIVEKGGVLSHCAIVAREMGVPAVSQIFNCHYRLKDGDRVWVDGNHGRVTFND